MFEAQVGNAQRDKDSMSETTMFTGHFGKFLLVQESVGQTTKFGCHIENSRAISCEGIVKNAEQSLATNGKNQEFHDEISTSTNEKIPSPKTDFGGNYVFQKEGESGILSPISELTKRANYLMKPKRVVKRVTIDHEARVSTYGAVDVIRPENKIKGSVSVMPNDNENKLRKNLGRFLRYAPKAKVDEFKSYVQSAFEDLVPEHLGSGSSPWMAQIDEIQMQFNEHKTKLKASAIVKEGAVSIEDETHEADHEIICSVTTIESSRKEDAVASEAALPELVDEKDQRFACALDGEKVNEVVPDLTQMFLPYQTMACCLKRVINVSIVPILQKQSMLPVKRVGHLRLTWIMRSKPLVLSFHMISKLVTLLCLRPTVRVTNQHKVPRIVDDPVPKPKRLQCLLKQLLLMELQLRLTQQQWIFSKLKTHSCWFKRV